MALKDNLIACYEMNETSGTTCTDAHTGGLNGTIAGTISVNQTGKLDKCYLFPHSTSSYVSLPAGTKITGATARTLTAWVKTATLAEPCVIISMGDAATNQWFSFEISNLSASSKYKLYFQKYGTVYTSTAGYVPDATWTFVFLKFDGSSTLTMGTVTSGTVAKQNFSVGTINTGSTNVPYIGRFNFAAAEPFDGNIDQLAIWNRALSDAELQEIENSGSGLAYSSWDGGGGTSYTLTAEQGTFTVTGQAATLTTARSLTATNGSYTQTGQSASLLYGRTLTASPGSYVLTGQDAAITTARTITADNASFAITGSAVNLVTTRTISAEQGAYTLTGYDVSLTASVARTLTAEHGTYAINGQDTALLRGSLLSPEVGNYTLTGQGSGLLASRSISCEQGAFTLTGFEMYFPDPTSIGTFTIHSKYGLTYRLSCKYGLNKIIRYH